MRSIFWDIANPWCASPELYTQPRAPTPSPLIFNSAAIRDRCHGLVVEEYPILLSYSKRGGGRPAAGTEKHAKMSYDMMLLVHGAGADFTCNKRVTTDDTFGNSSDSSPSLLQGMQDLPCESAGMDIPMRAMNFLINRCDIHMIHHVRSRGLRLGYRQVDGTRK